MDSDDEEEKEATKKPKFPITMYISEGNKYLRLTQYIKAIEFFDIALEREPSNVQSLLGRSKCNMRLAEYSKAKEDAEAALTANSKSSEAKLLIGEAEYLMGDFEKAFLTYYNAHVVRPNCEGLKLGHQMCKKGIENALNPDYPITFNNKDIAGLSNVKPMENDSKVPPKQKLIKDFLSPDVDFLEKLLNDDSIESVHPDCKYLVGYLKERQKAWKTQNPETLTIKSVSSSKTKRNITEEETKKMAESHVKSLDKLSSSSEDEG